MFSAEVVVVQQRPNATLCIRASVVTATEHSLSCQPRSGTKPVHFTASRPDATQRPQALPTTTPHSISLSRDPKILRVSSCLVRREYVGVWRLSRSSGGPPLQLAAAMRPSQQARLVLSADPPYRIAHVNEAWSSLMGHLAEEAKMFSYTLMNVREQRSDRAMAIFLCLSAFVMLCSALLSVRGVCSLYRAGVGAYPFSSAQLSSAPLRSALLA